MDRTSSCLRAGPGTSLPATHLRAKWCWPIEVALAYLGALAAPGTQAAPRALAAPGTQAYLGALAAVSYPTPTYP
jgi:hypothetical protein